MSKDPLPIGSALHHIGTEVDAEIETAFNRWCEEHLRANLAVPGFVSVRRFVKDESHPGAGESPKYVTIYQLEDASALTSDAYAAHDSSLPEVFSGRIRFQRSVYREIGADPAARLQPTGAAILHVTVDVDPAHTDYFLKWYAQEHVPAVLEAPGMIGARRFENIELKPGARLPEGQHSYCTLYEMEDAGVVSRPETLEASRRGACPAALEPHRVAFNHAYDEIFRAVRSDD